MIQAKNDKSFPFQHKLRSSSLFQNVFNSNTSIVKKKLQLFIVMDKMY